jgi:hypothetical protein
VAGWGGGVNGQRRGVEAESVDLVVGETRRERAAVTPEALTPEATSSTLYWYRGRDARPQGPLRLERLRELWLHGGLDLHSLIWCEDWPHWKPLCLVPELSRVCARGVPTPAPVTRRRPPGDTFPPLPSLATEEEAWLRQMQALKARVRQVSERPTRPLRAVTARRGAWLLLGAFLGPVLIAVLVSALIVFLPRPVLPARVRSLVRPLVQGPKVPASAVPTPGPRFTPVPSALPVTPPPPPAARAAEDIRATVAPVRSPVRPLTGRVVQVSGQRPSRDQVVFAQCETPRPLFDPSSPEYEQMLDTAFERELGFGDTHARPEPVKPRRTVYLPPEPGVVPPETLKTSDIVEVVRSHKESLLACIIRYAPERPEGEEKQRVVVRWSVRVSGSVTDVLVEDEQVRDTPFGQCLEALVRGWTFPRHRVPSAEPVRFPFTY